jgi:hypothetical protein
MPMLIVSDPAAPKEFTIGGKPLAGAGFTWPTCACCEGPMQFLAQLPVGPASPAGIHRDQVILLFQCQNDPGLCDEWDPDSGGNHAALVPMAGRGPVPVPGGETLLADEDRLRLVPYVSTAADDEGDPAYLDAIDAPDSKVLGKLGGEPVWMQDDETPTCDCGATMQFVAQIEDRGGGGINFGDAGIGYAFACPACPTSAKFLWQSG